MSSFFSFLITLLWLGTHALGAFEPARVNGVVSIEVDHSKPIWSVKVTNQSKDELSYEMMGKVPRGLGLEVWGPWKEHEILRVHAEDLAEYLNVDGFPADIRILHPGKSITFPLNPKSMSATSVEAFSKWKTTVERGYYHCRTFFGHYSSPAFEISPPERKKAKPPQKKEPAIPLDPNSEEHYGIQFRRNLEKNNQALVHYYSGSRADDDYYLELSTYPKAEFDKLADWDGSAPLAVPFHKLVNIGKQIAAQKLKKFILDELYFFQTQDCSSKHYFVLSFSNDDDQITIELLPDGTPITSTKLKLNVQQYRDIREHGIPLLKRKD